jgi:uncharacterized protein (DUF885 family)
MMRSRAFWPVLLWVACLLACQGSAARQSDAAKDADRTADAIFDSYFEEYLELFPSFATTVGDHRFDHRLENHISGEHRRRQAELYSATLDSLDRLDSHILSSDRRLSYDVLRYQLTNALALLEFPSHLMPIDFMNCLPDEFATLGSGKGEHPFTSLVDYENFLDRVDDYLVWVDTAITNMRTGIREGYVLPRIVAERTLELVERQVVADPETSPFVEPLRRLPGLLSEAEATDLEQRYRLTIRDQLLPSYSRLATFLRDEYLPACRDSVAWSDLPNGKAWYRLLVRSWTTTDQTPELIHQLGLREVARLSMEYRQAVAAAETAQSAPRYSSEAELLRAYEQLAARIEPGLDALFGFAPRTLFEVRSTHLGAHYRPGSEDGTRPGVFLVNTNGLTEHPKTVSEALFLHEAIPGHHYQMSLQREALLPRFRKHSYMYAYMEGWGLYAESLGPELGLFVDSEANADRLHSELFRAIRLVVDTGIHDRGWSAERALEYFREHIGYAPGREVARYIAWPGQALTYKVGEQTILMLRERARSSLGPEFDIREFHERLLLSGPLPLDLLEREVELWIEGDAERD